MCNNTEQNILGLLNICQDISVSVNMVYIPTLG